jgi:hypothetical protein
MARQSVTWHDDDPNPSDDDLERFGDEGDPTGWCPDCGAECWDDAEQCPSCGNLIGGRVRHRPRLDRELQRRFTVVVVVLVLIAFLIVVL